MSSSPARPAPQSRPRVLARALLLAGFLATGVAGACAEAESLAPPDDAPNMDLEISLTADELNPAEGDLVTFTVTVRNLGPIEVTGIRGGDTLADGLTYESHEVTAGNYNAQSGLWMIGTLPVDGEAQLQLTAAVDAGTGGTSIANAAGVISTDMWDTVLVNNIAEVDITVQEGSTPPPPPPPPGLVFSSDWSAATGNTQNALTDGGRWEWLCCDLPSQIMSIVSASSVGFTRSTNVLRLQQRGTLGSQMAAPALPQSTTHWGRFYFRSDEVGTWHQHPTAYNAIGSIQGIPWTRWGKAGGVEIGAKLFGHGYPHEQWTPTTDLTNGTWYRYEWQIQYTSATQYRFDVRVYNMAGTQIMNASDFKRADWTGTGHSLQSFQDAGNRFTFASPSLARRFGLGNEGPAGSTNTLGYWYIANVALSTAGWIGQ